MQIFHANKMTRLLHLQFRMPSAAPATTTTTTTAASVENKAQRQDCLLPLHCSSQSRINASKELGRLQTAKVVVVVVDGRGEESDQCVRVPVKKRGELGGVGGEMRNNLL